MADQPTSAASPSNNDGIRPLAPAATVPEPGTSCPIAGRFLRKDTTAIVLHPFTSSAWVRRRCWHGRCEATPKPIAGAGAEAKQAHLGRRRAKRPRTGLHSCVDA